MQLVAVQCLAVLSTDDRLKLEIAVSGGMRLLSAASCSADLELQQAAADAVANMCTDTAIIHVVRTHTLVLGPVSPLKSTESRRLG
jgi:hypothetical protein